MTLSAPQQAAFDAAVAIWSTANPTGDFSAIKAFPPSQWATVSDGILDEFSSVANLGSDDTLISDIMAEIEKQMTTSATSTEAELLTKVGAVADWRSEFKNRVLAHARALGWNPAMVAPTTPPAPAAPVAPPPRTKALTPGVLDPQLAGIVGASLARYRSGLVAIERALLDLVATGKFDEAKRVVEFVRDHPGAYGGPECSELLLAFFQERIGLIMGHGDLKKIKERFGST